LSRIINQYSALWIAIALVAIIGLVLLQRGFKWTDVLALGVVVAGLLVAWMLLHPRQTPLMQDSRQVQEMIGAGTPVLLEFQSPY
jgi:membrane protein implicated in regulation of membrane protease activity